MLARKKELNRACMNKTQSKNADFHTKPKSKRPLHEQNAISTNMSSHKNKIQKCNCMNKTKSKNADLTQTQNTKFQLHEQNTI